MAKYYFKVMVNAVEGQDDALNDWLDNHHLPEVLQTEGFVSVQRFVLTPDEAANPKATHRYMHIFTIESDDLAKTKDALRAGGATRMPAPPALDTSNMVTLYYQDL